jgi:predicted phosphate transport protein (TIGR00153 family)
LARFSLIPKDMEFYDLFERETSNLVVAAKKLADLFDNYQNVETKAKELKDLEHQGDAITHEVIARAQQSFVTPIDREDITQLAHSLDDVMDFIWAAGRTANLYHIAQPREPARELARIVVKMAMKLNEVVPRLRRHDHFPWILEQCVEINTLENDADDVQHAALAELFDVCSADTCEVIKWREIYGHLESATDRGEDVADVLEGIVLKHA